MNQKLDKIWSIMNEGFDEEFIRSYDDQLKLFNKEAFHLDYIYQAEDIVGFVTWWGLQGFNFIEHFAIKQSCRGIGLGRATIQRHLQKGKLLVLEVEISNPEIDGRRIRFYESCGFFQNHYYYEQPSMKKNYPPVPMMIMSSKPLSEDEFKDVKDELYKNVYFS